MRIIDRVASSLTCRTIGGAFDLARRRFPDVVRVETTNACNARCTICPHRRMQRPIRRMDDQRFAQIVDECARHGCREIHLHNFGEPLLDRSLEERIRYAKRRRLKKVKIFSNGSLIDAGRARGLVAAGLDEIKISIDGATREEFERIRFPLKFDKVIQNIKDLVAVRNDAQSDLTIRVACCSTSDKNGTMRSLEEIVDGFSFGKVHNWASGDFPTNGRRIRKPCSRLWRTFTILSNGGVALCCLDYDGNLLLGKVGDGASILEIWNGDAYRRVRQKHKDARQAEISLCSRCSKSFL